MLQRDGWLRRTLTSTEGATRFNRRCAWAALAWLIVVHAALLAFRPAVLDFSQYYLGALTAARGDWSMLYPQELPNAKYNVGGWDASSLRPEQAALAEAHGLRHPIFRFIQTPPVAVALWPLGLLTLTQALWAWSFVLLLSVWAMAQIAGRTYTLCAGRESRVSGLLVLLVVTSPMTLWIVRLGNVTPIVAACLGIVALDLALASRRHPASRRSAWAASVAMVVGFFAKYATPALVPLQVLAGRWRVLLLSTLLGLLTLALTFAVTGPGPFVTFATDVAPTLPRPHPSRFNTSIVGFLMRLTQQDPLAPALGTAVKVAQWATLLVVLGLLWRARRQLAVPNVLFAGAVALIVWMVLFAPVAWDHYAAYLVPFYGWAAWCASARGWRRWVALAAVALAWCPPSARAVIVLPEPLNTYVLLSNLLLFTLALATLARPAHASPQAPSTSPATSPT